MVDFVKFILHILGRPKMYYIQKIEDFYYTINGYIAGAKNENYNLFIERFTIYLKSKYQCKEENILYVSLIRSMTIYDENTLQILKNEFIEFLSNDVTLEDFFSSKDLFFLNELCQSR